MEPLVPGCLVEARVVGVMKFEDAGEVDDKIISYLKENYPNPNDLDDEGYFDMIHDIRSRFKLDFDKGNEIAETYSDMQEDSFARGGKMKVHKQRREQYYDRDVERYGSRDSKVSARLVGYRYKKIYDKRTGKLRKITKSDKEYYGKVSQKDIKDFENGNSSTKRRVYWEARRDHSDSQKGRF